MRNDIRHQITNSQFKSHLIHKAIKNNKIGFEVVTVPFTESSSFSQSKASLYLLKQPKKNALNHQEHEYFCFYPSPNGDLVEERIEQNVFELSKSLAPKFMDDFVRAHTFYACYYDQSDEHKAYQETSRGITAFKVIATGPDDFWAPCLMGGTIDNETVKMLEHTRPQLRWGRKDNDDFPYGWRHDGVYKRNIPNKSRSLHPRKVKRWYSKHQSFTVVSHDNNFLPPSFACQYINESYLMGISIAYKDDTLLIQRIMGNDGGTVARPSRFKKRETAERIYNKGLQQHRLFKNFQDLFTYGKKTIYNESQLRYRFKADLTSRVTIFIKDFNSRKLGACMLGQLRGRDAWQRLRAQAVKGFDKQRPTVLSSSYRVPLDFYIAGQGYYYYFPQRQDADFLRALHLAVSKQHDEEEVNYIRATALACVILAPENEKKDNITAPGLNEKEFQLAVEKSMLNGKLLKVMSRLTSDSKKVFYQRYLMTSGPEKVIYERYLRKQSKFLTPLLNNVNAIEYLTHWLQCVPTQDREEYVQAWIDRNTQHEVTISLCYISTLLCEGDIDGAMLWLRDRSLNKKDFDYKMIERLAPEALHKFSAQLLMFIGNNNQEQLLKINTALFLPIIARCLPASGRQKRSNLLRAILSDESQRIVSNMLRRLIQCKQAKDVLIKSNASADMLLSLVCSVSDVAAYYADREPNKYNKLVAPYKAFITQLIDAVLFEQGGKEVILDLLAKKEGYSLLKNVAFIRQSPDIIYYCMKKLIDDMKKDDACCFRLGDDEETEEEKAFYNAIFGALYDFKHALKKECIALVKRKGINKVILEVSPIIKKWNKVIDDFKGMLIDSQRSTEASLYRINRINLFKQVLGATHLDNLNINDDQEDKEFSSCKQNIPYIVDALFDEKEGEDAILTLLFGEGEEEFSETIRMITHCPDMFNVCLTYMIKEKIQNDRKRKDALRDKLFGRLSMLEKILRRRVERLAERRGIDDAVDAFFPVIKGWNIVVNALDNVWIGCHIYDASITLHRINAMDLFGETVHWLNKEKLCIQGNRFSNNKIGGRQKSLANLLKEIQQMRHQNFPSFTKRLDHYTKLLKDYEKSINVGRTWKSHFICYVDTWKTVLLLVRERALHELFGQLGQCDTVNEKIALLKGVKKHPVFAKARNGYGIDGRTKAVGFIKKSIEQLEKALLDEKKASDELPLYYSDGQHFFNKKIYGPSQQLFKTYVLIEHEEIPPKNYASN